MNFQPLFFEGNFELWVYDVSHGRLLFRKKAAAPGERRVDILFNDVRAMQVCTFLESIKVEEVKSSDLVGIPTSRITKEPGLRWFKVTSKGCDGYIYAGALSFHVDDAGFAEPSAIYQAGPLLVKLAITASGADGIPKTGRD